MTARRADRRPRVPPAVLRLGARQLGRRCLNPALAWPVQRTRLDQLTQTSLLPRGTTVTEQVIAGLRAEVVSVGDSSGRRRRPSARWSISTAAATVSARRSRPGRGRRT